MSPIALILARGGSKGLPGKHLRHLNGVPLIGHVVSTARQEVPQVYVSTNDPEIAETADEFGAQVICRPDEMAQDHSRYCDGVFHGLHVLEQDDSFDVVVQLEGATVLLTEGLISRGLKQLQDSEADSVLSIVPAREKHPDWAVECGASGRIQYRNEWLPAYRQGLRTAFHVSGACRCSWRSALERAAARDQPGRWWDFDLDVQGMVIEESDFVHIDTERDLAWAEFLLNQHTTTVPSPPSPGENTAEGRMRGRNCPSPPSPREKVAEGRMRGTTKLTRIQQ